MSNSNLRTKSILVLLLIPFYSFCLHIYPEELSRFAFLPDTGKNFKKNNNHLTSNPCTTTPELTSIDFPLLYNSSPVRPMVHVGLGGGDYSFTAMGVSVFRQINSSFMVGISAHYFGENGKNSFLYKWQKIPLTLESIIDLKKYQKNRSSVYIKIGVGYSFTLNGSFYDPNEYIHKKVTNGWSFNPGLGYRFNFLQNTGLNFDVSYHLIVDKILDEQDSVLAKNYWKHILFRTSVFF